MSNTGGGRPRVLAHRGASAVRPENTIEAFLYARELGADGVELDVRASEDGYLVVQHDARLADGRPIADTGRADLPASVPTLDEALDACAGMVVNVEIKHERADGRRDLAVATADRLAERAHRSTRSSSGLGGHRFEQLLVSSFDATTLRVVRDRQPGLATAALGFDVDSMARWVSEVAAAGHTAVNPSDHLVDEAMVALARREGLAIYVWTVDDPVRIVELAALGVDGIITNVPDVALSALKE
jgi:glycerophosphoryl diester phosphodiesterase